MPSVETLIKKLKQVVMKKTEFDNQDEPYGKFLAYLVCPVSSERHINGATNKERAFTRR